jgi:hypothetical protein
MPMCDDILFIYLFFLTTGNHYSDMTISHKQTIT